MSWQENARCRGATEVFTPDHSDPARMQPLANRFCSRCPVVEACGRLGDKHTSAGLWGGAFRYRAGGTGDYQWQTLTVGAHIPVKGKRRPGTAARWAA